MSLHGVNIKHDPDVPAGYIVTVFEGAAPASGNGTINLGSFEHDGGDDTLPGSSADEVNHVMVHHVQDILYKTDFRNFNTGSVSKWPDNITSLQHVKIIRNVAVNSVTIANADAPLAVGATVQLNVDVDPDDATNAIITYTSSHPARATVSNTGLVTGVATGAAVITATAGGQSDTVTFTVP